MRKIIIILTIILTLILGINIAQAKSQFPKDIINGKYICITKMIGSAAYIDCDNTYTAHRIVKPGKIEYIVRDRKDKNFIMLCGYKDKKLINCYIRNT